MFLEFQTAILDKVAEFLWSAACAFSMLPVIVSCIDC